MFILNTHRHYLSSLEAGDASFLNEQAAEATERLLALCPVHRPTPLHSFPALARSLQVGTVHVKDEGQRLGLNSFKALGGAYAIIRLVLDETERQTGRKLDGCEVLSPEVRTIARYMTFGCATDGNHGRSVAAGAKLVGARSAIFVHEGVSSNRVDAIERFGAEIIRVAGTYDDAVSEASRTCAEQGWTIVSDTAWPGYERIPSQVMQGYTVRNPPKLASGSHTCFCASRSRWFSRRRGGLLRTRFTEHDSPQDHHRRARTRRMPVRKRASRRSRKDQSWTAHHHGHARMLRTLARCMENTEPLRRRLHDRFRRSCRRRNALSCATRPRRAGYGCRREWRSRSCRPC
jgi:hypothetical protein